MAGLIGSRKSIVLCIDKYVAKQSLLITNIAAWNENILPNVLKEYSPNDIFNVDELWLFFKLMLDKSLMFEHEMLWWQTK